MYLCRENTVVRILILHNLINNFMKTNLSSQITLHRVSPRYYRPENAFEKSVLTRLEKIPTDIYESVEEGANYIAREIAQTIREKQKAGRFCVLALPGGNSPSHVYQELIRDSLAIPFVSGPKTESEKFAGAQDTYTVEALMHDGKALQSATSHFFGNAFPDAFDIKYLDKNNELHSVYETSWGLSTRIIGALIMVHGDDSGLVLPPRIAPVQTRVIPIAQHKEGVLEKANELTERLKKAGYSVKIDDSEKSPGWKFSEQEMLGIPTRIEIGPKDIEQNQVVVVRRDTREKIVVSLDEIETKLGEILETIQKDMYDRAKAFLDSHIDFAETMDEMNEKFNTKRGFIKAKWCGSAECEDEIKAATGGATTRCICKEDQVKDGDTCIFCGKQAKHVVYFGKAY